MRKDGQLFLEVTDDLFVPYRDLYIKSQCVRGYEALVDCPTGVDTVIFSFPSQIGPYPNRWKVNATNYDPAVRGEFTVTICGSSSAVDTLAASNVIAGSSGTNIHLIQNTGSTRSMYVTVLRVS
jgi:hypothetical protein